MPNRKPEEFTLHRDDGSQISIFPVGRDAWALSCLIAAGETGCTPIDTPGPRWSGYVHKLRTVYGVTIETIEEKHGGPFAGTHARYVLHSKVTKASEKEAA